MKSRWLKIVQAVDEMGFTSFVIVLVVAMMFLWFFDLSGLDTVVYRALCPPFAVCATYYDIPFWETMIVIGTVFAGFVALATAEISKKQFEKEREQHRLELLDADLPILVPVLNDNNVLHHSGSIRFTFRNVGKGIAKEISIIIEDLEEKTDISLEPNANNSVFNPTNVNMAQFVKADKLNIEYVYHDIHDREHRTVGVSFKNDKSNKRFVPLSGNWKFKKDI